MTAVAWLVILSAALVENIRGMQVIPERTKILAVNPKYLTEGKFYVKRYSRRGNYYINIEGWNQQSWHNNVSAHFIFYEFLHNEYKRSFVEMHFRFCDLIKKDPYIGRALAATGVSCPMLPGRHRFLNLTVPTENFPNVWPFERSKIDISAYQLPSEEQILNVELYVLFKQNHGK